MNKTAKILHLGDVAIPTHQEFDFRIGLGSGDYQRIWHRQRFCPRSQPGRAVAYRHINGHDAGDEICEEARHMFLVMVTKPRAGKHLGVSYDRDEEAMGPQQIPNRLVRGGVQIV
jgi:hypothetical protein